jgi:cytochrome c oxidase subunit 3
MWLFQSRNHVLWRDVCAYLIYRLAHFNDFAAVSNSLNIKLGAGNTVVLLLSSLTVVLAVNAAQRGKRKLLVFYLIATIVLGLAFLGVKAVEYHDKFVEHHVPGPNFNFVEEHAAEHSDRAPVNQQYAQMFFSLYFVMTGMHAIHMIIGVGLFAGLAVMAWKGRYDENYNTPVETRLVRHFLDVVDLSFPLLYGSAVTLGRHVGTRTLNRVYVEFWWRCWC